MLELVGVQKLGAHRAAVGRDKVAIGVDRVAGIFALCDRTKNILVSRCVDSQIDGLAVCIHARALGNRDLRFLAVNFGNRLPGRRACIYAAELDMIVVMLLLCADELDMNVSAGN